MCVCVFQCHFVRWTLTLGFCSRFGSQLETHRRVFVLTSPLLSPAGTIEAHFESYGELLPCDTTSSSLLGLQASPEKASHKDYGQQQGGGGGGESNTMVSEGIAAVST